MTTTRRQRERMKIRANMDMTLPAKTPPKKKIKVRKTDDTPEPEQVEVNSPEVVTNGHDEGGLIAQPIRKLLSQPVWTPDEVATLFRVSPETVLALVEDGDLPAFTMLEETRVLRKDVLDFIRLGREKPERIRRYHENNLRPPVNGATIAD